MDMKIGGTDSQTGGGGGGETEFRSEDWDGYENWRYRQPDRGRGGGVRPNSGVRIGMDMKIGGTDSQTGGGGGGGG